MNKEINVKMVVPVGTEKEIEEVLKGWLSQKRAELKEFNVKDEELKEGESSEPPAPTGAGLTVRKAQ